MNTKKIKKTTDRTYTCLGTYNETEAVIAVYLPDVTGGYTFNRVFNLSQTSEGDNYNILFVRMKKRINETGVMLANTMDIQVKTIKLDLNPRTGKTNAIAFDPTTEKSLIIVYHTDTLDDIDKYVDSYYDRGVEIFKDVDSNGPYQEFWKLDSPRKAGMSLIVKA